MIYTTNYNNLWKVRRGYKILCITTGQPPVVMDNIVKFWVKDLAPGWDIKSLADEGKYEEFEKEYTKKILNNINTKDLIDRYGKDIVLVCFCKKGNFCHRTLAAKYIGEKENIPFKEL